MEPLKVKVGLSNVLEQLKLCSHELNDDTLRMRMEVSHADVDAMHSLWRSN